jgi:hypothetical protein
MILVLLLLFAQKPPSVSLAAPVDPIVAAKTHDQLAANLSPSAKSKVQSTALSIKTSTNITDAAGRAAVSAAFPGLNDSDIQALMFIVMMEASGSAQQDLQDIMSEVDKMNSQKSALRSQLPKNQAHSASVAKVIVQTAPVDYYRAPDPLPANASATDIEKRLKDLDAMTSANQLRLQTLRSRQQQMMSVVSNTFKAAQSVKGSVLQNLK